MATTGLFDNVTPTGGWGAWMVIPLGRGYEAIVDAEDYARLAPFPWTAYKDGHRMYAITRWRYGPGNARKKIWMHRMILKSLRRDEKVDHRDGDGLNNRKANLRPCSDFHNAHNSRPNHGRRFKGVSFRKGRGDWQAYIYFDSSQIHLGVYASEEAAAQAYDRAAEALFGEFARLNFPKEQVGGI